VSEQRAREALDARVREVIHWHFSPETGCPFWLQYASRLDWDPRKEVRGFADLERFGTFQPEWLREPIGRWIPKGLAGKRVFAFETGDGGSRISVDDFRTDWERFGATLPEDAFPKGVDWLALSPTGPRRARLSVEHMVQQRGGICFLVDMDPRWVARLIKLGKTDAAERYRQHVIDQGLTVLRAHENVRCVFAAPKLLEALCERVSLKKMGITGVLCSGDGLTARFHKQAVEELLGGVPMAVVYDHPLAGAMAQGPAPDDALAYYPASPGAAVEVAGEDGQVVDYGATGRLRITVLSKELFVPRRLDRRQAERQPPCEIYPWDGIRNPR
jgi:hypothetical protein